MRLHVQHRQHRQHKQRWPVFRGARGYAMAALLVSIAVMGILMSVAMPAWRHAARREKEAELVFRGEQYARAIGLYQRRFAAAFPPSLDVLVEQKFLRRKYKDPMTEDGKFQVLYQASLAASAPGGGSAPSTLSGSGSQTGPSGPTGGAGPGGRSWEAPEVGSLESSARARRNRSACITTGITTTNGFSSTSPRRPSSAGRRVSSKATPAVSSRGDPSQDSSGRGRGAAAEEAVSPQVAKGSAHSSLGPQEDRPAVARARRRHRVRVDHRDSREGADGKAQGLPGDRPPPTPGEIAIDHGKSQDLRLPSREGRLKPSPE